MQEKRLKRRLKYGTKKQRRLKQKSGGVLFLSVLTFFVTYQSLIPIHGAVQLFSNSSRTWILRKHIKKEFFWFFMLGCMAGVLIAIFLIGTVKSKTIPYLLISALIFYSIFRPKKLPQMIIPNWGFIFVGIVSGILGMVIGATGPFLAPFFLRDDLSKEEIVATKSSMQTFVHFTKIPAFLYLGFSYKENILLIAILCISAIVGTNVGVRILRGIDEKLFFIIFKSILFIAALRLIYKAIL